VNNKKIMAASWVAASMCAVAWCQAPAATTAAIADCTGVTEAKSKSRQTDDLQTFMFTAVSLENRGEARFHAQYITPPSECVFGKFDAGATPVEAIYSPVVEDLQTTHWRFHVPGAQPRDIIVFYDGNASLMSKKTIFQVVEERDGSILFYSMFRDRPTYEALKPLVTSIIDGSLKPVVGLRWPPGAKEPLMDAYDIKRYK